MKGYGSALSLVVMVLASANPAVLVGQNSPPAAQIKAALTAAPEAARDGARVLGYDASGAVVELRAGTNDLVCLADRPGDTRFDVACYHESIEPYMARGRELRAEGVDSAQARYRIRWAEADDGTLSMPDKPATAYLYAGPVDAWDPATGEVTGGSLRWVIYVPGATTESTGLMTQPIESGPWLMFPGTPGAHIMITPTR